MTVGEILKQKRLEAHMTNKELANRAETTSSMISHIESGYRIPSLALAYKLAVALNCTLDELVGRKVG